MTEDGVIARRAMARARRAMAPVLQKLLTPRRKELRR